MSGPEGAGVKWERSFFVHRNYVSNLFVLLLSTNCACLPFSRRSISKFYTGKSKSFTSLADAASISSVKEIVKPEDAYTRKRKNLLAQNNFFGKNRSFIPGAGNGGIYKRPINSRSSSALAATMSCSDSNYSSESLNSSPSSPCLSRPPLPPQTRRHNKESSLSPPEQKFNAWRSFSLSDLQGAAAATPSLMGIKE